MGWESTKPTKNNLCGGEYVEPKSILDVPNPPPLKTTQVKITAKGPVIFRADGTSVLQDDVMIVQPGRRVYADKAFLYHNKKTGKIGVIKLVGHVRVQEAGKLIVGKQATYNIPHNTFTINHAIYHITGKYQLLSLSTPFDAWGIAESAHRVENGIIQLTHATYTTCSPVDPTWLISADTLELNHIKEKGYAHGVVLRFKKIPIFYTPYYSFPLSRERKSGFLTPFYGYNKQNGFFVGQPYYWNMAPNYDLVFTPEWYSNHGFQLNGNFRYLTEQSDGVFYASFLPDDSAFSQFKQNTLATTTPTPDNLPYLNALNSFSDSRTFINFENHFRFNPQWSGLFYARYVSDPYYPTAFQSQFLTSNTNQIPSFAELNYNGLHWQDMLLVQTYQTLHPYSQFLSPVQNQYTRLPELDVSAAYPDFYSNFNFDLSGQVVQFDYQSNYVPFTYQVPIGSRIHLAPSISHPFTWTSAYLTPQLIADNVDYFTQMPSSTPTAVRPYLDQGRTLPIFDIDSGWYMDRSFQLGGKDYIQTLEPRLFYLYVPFLNQNNFPNFDTQLLPFSVSNLYATNAFSGFDRLQNANQLTVGLSSRILDPTDSNNILIAQLGFIDYFTNPSVCLVQGCQPVAPRDISPITSALTWNPNPRWSFGSQAAWDTVEKQINNAQVGMQYHIDPRHVLMFGYQFVHADPDNPLGNFAIPTNSSLLTAGLAWPITMHWSFIGYTYYDIENHRPQNQYFGLSYDACCWSFRAIVADNFNGAPPVTLPNGSVTSMNQYSTYYYFEFMLKGLGGGGNRHAESMLMSTIPGFEDNFSPQGHYNYNQSF